MLIIVDIDMPVFENNTISIEDEFVQIQKWIVTNNIKNESNQDKRISFHHPQHQRTFLSPPPIFNCIEIVVSAKLVGVFITDTLRANEYVGTSSKYVTWISLRSRDIHKQQFLFVFDAVVLFFIMYAFTVWIELALQVCDIT